MSYWRWGFEAIIITIYGQNRCGPLGGLSSDGPSNGTLLHDECSLYKRMATVMDKAELDMESVSGWMDIYLADKPHLLQEIRQIQTDLTDLKLMSSNVTALTEDAELTQVFYQNSYVLKQFGLVDETLVMNIIYLVTFVALCRLGAYIALRWKARF